MRAISAWMKNFRLSHRILYLPSKAHSPRIHADFQRCAKVAEETGKAVCGIKGRSILAEHIDLVNGLHAWDIGGHHRSIDELLLV